MRLSPQQRAVLRYVSEHPGTTAADITRWEGFGGRLGHAASYARVARLRRVGLLHGTRDGARTALTLAPAGARALDL